MYFANVYALSAGALILGLSLFWSVRGWIFHHLDLLIARLRGVSENCKQNSYLKGKYAPVHSESHEDVLIEGSMPEAMHGAYIRNGPNPLFDPIGGYHWFDGDGMTHTVRINAKKARYSNRYIHTSRLKQEKTAGWPLFSKFGDAIGVGYLAQMLLQWLKVKTGVIDQKHGAGTANTALVYHARRLHALHEGDLPYALRVLCSGIINTIGRHTFDGQLQHKFTAHPKIDKRTGEMFAFGYSLDKAPYLSVFSFDPKGSLISDVPVTLQRPVMMHDCAITEDYFVILDMPLFFEPERMVKKGALPFIFDTEAGSRIGLLPRCAENESDIKWFSLPSQMIFHTANAWQESATCVKLVACCFEEFDFDLEVETHRDSHNVPYVHIISLDLLTGTATRRRLSAVPGDFPTINNSFMGYRCRYMYIAHVAKQQPKEPLGFGGITKLDMWALDEQSAVVGQLDFPAGFEGGEPFFVPKCQTGNSTSDEEDAGYLTTFVTNDSGESRLMVYDATTMTTTATVHIPCRVPLGFHGLHLTEDQLSSQK